ncbi:MAG: DUF4129 domain-containing protein [Betaproteobacteria bacterium]|nr:DUF4129 domain-containing protein [Betaproteobacteria bacterium]
MQPDRLAVVLRPRVGWEALDLGFQMAREWWRPIWAVWFSVYLPVAALCLLVFSNRFHAVLVLWWLKPAFDRAILHTVSRAVFGEPQGALATIRAMREWLPPGIITALTLSRLNLARSFALPVAQLENQRGADSRRRHAALGSRMRNVGVWLTVVCAHFEWVAMFGLAGLVRMLEPSAGDLGPEDDESDRPVWAQLANWGLKEIVFYLAAVSLIEPFYVTAGFALYLNRRAILEGWDIELALRRLEERLRTSANTVSVVLIAAVAMSWVLADPPSAFAADAAQKTAQDEIRVVLKSPEFSQVKDVTRWRYIGESRSDTRKSVPAIWRYLSSLFGEITAFVLWIAAAVLLVAALYYLRRFIPEPQLRDGARYRPPDTLFGFDLAPESLPDDVAAAAAELSRKGHLREALSLLYRGALSALVHRHQLQLGVGDTEGDCARAVRQTLPASADYFVRLVGAWQATAYAARETDAASIRRLCDEWRPHFSPKVPS